MHPFPVHKRSENRYRYSYAWAQEVVERFLEKYSRGAFYLTKCLGISYQDISESLIDMVRRSNQLAWESRKRMIKAMEYESFDDVSKLPPSLRQNYIAGVLTLYEDDTLDDDVGQIGN